MYRYTVPQLFELKKKVQQPASKQVRIHVYICTYTYLNVVLEDKKKKIKVKNCNMAKASQLNGL